jgi:hypothetical protein
MQSFQQYYFLQEKITSDLRRAFTVNLFKKRKVGVDVGKGKYKLVLPVDTTLFQRFKEDLRREVVNAYRIKKQENTGRKHISTSKKLKLELGKLYVSDAYDGEIDSGSDLLEGTPISTMVYQLNTGARIAFITTEDENGYIRQYVATNARGNDYFRVHLGTTLQQINADSKSSRKLITKNRSSLFKSSNELNKIADIIQKEISQDNEPDNEITNDTDNEYGILDISKEDYNIFKDYWGIGKISTGKNVNYPFKGKFKRERYFNDVTGYNGYKYYDNKGHEIYLIDTNDDINAFIGLPNKNSLDWAKNINMFALWKNTPGNISQIIWRSGQLKDNLE